MRKKNRGSPLGILLGMLLCCRGSLALSALDWPFSDGNMVSNFGFNLEGRPAVGLSVETEGPVRATEDGELFFFSSGEESASRLPSPLGAWLALDHGDGLISVYGRFAEAPEGPAGGLSGALLPANASRADIARSAVIAEAGSTGWSKLKGFFFAIFDRRERRWVNPSMIIAPLPDTRPPQIGSISLISDEGRRISLLGGSRGGALPRINQGRYRVAVEAADTRIEANEKPLAPHRIFCLVNGVEIGVLNFETYSARDGALMVDRNGLTPVSQVYAPYPAFEVGEVWFTRGQTTLEVLVQDITGNERSAVIRFTVE
jgi:hypothetical protein